MSEPFISRGFVGKHRGGVEKANRIPPGQYLTTDFPGLSVGFSLPRIVFAHAEPTRLPPVSACFYFIEEIIPPSSPQVSPSTIN